MRRCARLLSWSSSLLLLLAVASSPAAATSTSTVVMPRLAYSMEASLVGIGPVGDAVVIPFEDAVQDLSVGVNWGPSYGDTRSVVFSTPIVPPSSRIDVPSQKLWTFDQYAVGLDATISIVFEQAPVDGTGALHSTLTASGVLAPILIGRYFVLPGPYDDASFYIDGTLKVTQPIPTPLTVNMMLDGTCSDTLDCSYQIHYENAEVITVEAVGGGFGSNAGQRAQWTYSLAPIPIAIPEPSPVILALLGLARLSWRRLAA